MKKNLSKRSLISFLFNPSTAASFSIVFVRCWFSSRVWLSLPINTVIFSQYRKAIHKIFMQQNEQVYCYFHLTAICSGEPGSASSLLGPSPPVPEENSWEIMNTNFYGLGVLPATQTTVSKHWREHRALTLITSLNGGLISNHRPHP